MESERYFVPRPEKPPILYHGTITPNIELFEPRKRYTPSSDSGPRVYASGNPAFAAAHSFPWHSGEGVRLSCVGEQVTLKVPASLQDRLQQKVYLYSLDSSEFTFTEEDTAEQTYHTDIAVKPRDVKEFSSVIEAVEYYGGNVEIISDAEPDLEH